MRKDPEESQEDELARLRTGARDDAETIARLRAASRADQEEIGDLRLRSDRDAEQIRGMEADGREQRRFEEAQRALIAELRSDLGGAAAELDGIGDRLAAAERELVDLRAIRDALTPADFDQRDGMRIAAEMVPADPAVGGDFFFVGDGPDGVCVLAVGDVVGRGLAAARRAAFARTALASVAGFSDDPCQLLRWVNVAMVQRIGESADFVTAICVTIDPRTRTLQVAEAGHHAALRLRSGEELNGLRSGVALGLTADIGCEPARETVAPGDGVLIFTDGVIEARGADSRYGTDRVRDVVRRCGDAAPERLLRAITDDLHAFRAGATGDDVCMLALRVD